MDDIILKATIDSETTLYVSPIAAETYAEHIEQDNLGGVGGYFVLRGRRTGRREQLEIL